AEIRGETGKDQPGEAALAKITAQPGRRLAVILEESRIAVAPLVIALADDELRLVRFQPRMELCPRRALHAMVGPERLLAIGKLDRFEGRPARMLAGKARMVGGMPVLRQQH